MAERAVGPVSGRPRPVSSRSARATSKRVPLRNKAAGSFG